MSTTAPPALAVKEGDLVAGKYLIERVLAQGGMGVVVVARHEQLDQRVAIKLLLPEVAGFGQAVARFLREAQAAARIQSEHVCRVFDVGTLPNGAPYMVMELLDGADLSAELERRGTLPVAEAVSYVVEALDAIVEAHRRGIVHRDLKPSNLFLCRRDDGRVLVKVLDFGISKLEAPGGPAGDIKLTSTQALLGTPAYMSPEQVRSAKDVDARSDQWSIGVILYECLAGGTLFNGSSLGEVFSKIREDPIPPLSMRRADLPAELAHIVERCLQRKPEDRFASAGELREALRSFLGRFQTASAGPMSSSGAPPERSSVVSEAAFARTGLAITGDEGGALRTGSAGDGVGGSVPPRGSHSTGGAWSKPGEGRARRSAWVAAAAVALLGGVAGAWAMLARDGAGAAGAARPADPQPTAITTERPTPPSIT